MQRKRILVLAGFAPSLVNFRGALLKKLAEAGWEVIACAPGSDEPTEQKVRALGAAYERLTLDRTGINPIRDLRGFISLWRLIRAKRPDSVLSYTIKPVIYGSLAARAAGVPKVYSMITGLGYSFTKPSLINRIVRRLYTVALKRNDVVFFQNRDDEAEFRRLGILRRVEAADDVAMRQRDAHHRCSGPRTIVVSGSGVDLDYFQAGERRSDGVAEPLDSPASRSVVFLLIARLLRDKGIVEFAAAAKLLKRKYPACRFLLLGPYDPNPAALRPDEVKAWTDEGALEYLGQAEDVRPFLRDCDVYVLPSYREGTPRTVLEAMATGRAVITTDAPGCRETIRRESDDQKAGDTGFASPGALLDPYVGASEFGASVNARKITEGASTGGVFTGLRSRIIRGENGFLVPVRDADALAAAMEEFINDPSLTLTMGLQSRLYAEERYDVHKVNAVIMREIGANAPVSDAVNC